MIENLEEMTVELTPAGRRALREVRGMRQRLVLNPVTSAALLLAATSVASVWAQTNPPQAPNAGQLDRQLREAERVQEERERSRKPVEPALRVPPADAAVLGAGSVVLKLNALVWGESKYLTQSELDALAKPLLGTQVSFEQLQQWVEQINALYRSKGQFAARAILPPQTVQGGTVKVDLVESKADALTLKGSNLVRESWVRRWVPVTKGETVDTQALERGLQLWNASSDARLTADMVPGETAATTVVDAQLQEPARWGGSVGLATDGNDTTGRAQANASLRWFSPIGLGDKVSLGLTKSQGVKALSLQYALPLHPSGTRLTVGASSSKFDIVSGSFAVLGINGASNSSQLGLQQPVWSSGPWSAELSAAWNRQRSETFTSGLSPGSTLLKSATYGVSVSRRMLESDLSASYSAQSAELKPANGTSQNYTIFFGAAAAQFSLSAGQSVSVRTAWQKTPVSVLPSTLQYSVGGPSLVRGYGASAAFGEQGYSASVEYLRAINTSTTATVFYDRGSVWGATKTRLSIDSVGVGLDWRGSGSFERVSASGHIAYAMTPNLASVTGRTRALLRVNYSF